MKEKNNEHDILEAQFWWAFSCLAVAGLRNEENFHAEVVRRYSDTFPSEEEVDAIVKEACCHLATVLNRAKSGDTKPKREPNGWERHLIALSMRPVD